MALMTRLSVRRHLLTGSLDQDRLELSLAPR
jgi:hypothetical protein